MELTIINNQPLLTSLQAAEMLGKQHSDFMKSIRQFCEYMNEGKISLVDFFRESTYTDAKGENRPCYLLTEKGCEYIANKTTGKNGALFTARYIKLFHEMKEALLPSYEIEDPVRRAEKWIQEFRERQALTREVEYKEDVIIGLTKDVDLAAKQQRINDIVRHTVDPERIHDRWRLLYGEFDKVYHINSKQRLENAQERGEIGKITQLAFICKHLGMTEELYKTCVKLFESDARQIFTNIFDLL